MKWLRKKSESSSTISDNPATGKQIAYILQLVNDAGPRARRILKRAKVKGNPPTVVALSTLDASAASNVIGALKDAAPATRRQMDSLAHNLGWGDEGLSSEDAADFQRAKTIASPKGDSDDPTSYSHLTKKQSSEALTLLIGRLLSRDTKASCAMGSRLLPQSSEGWRLWKPKRGGEGHGQVHLQLQTHSYRIHIASTIQNRAIRSRCVNPSNVMLRLCCAGARTRTGTPLGTRS
jgi:hypothetical protein